MVIFQLTVECPGCDAKNKVEASIEMTQIPHLYSTLFRCGCCEDCYLLLVFSHKPDHPMTVPLDQDKLAGPGREVHVDTMTYAALCNDEVRKLFELPDQQEYVSSEGKTLFELMKGITVPSGELSVRLPKVGLEGIIFPDVLRVPTNHELGL